MKEVKDPEIKLFGKKIALPDNGKVLVISGNDPGGEFIDTSSDDSDRSLMIKANTCLEHKKVSRVGGQGKLEQVTEKDHLADGSNEPKPQDKALSPITDESTDPQMLSESDKNPKTPSIDEETAPLQSPKTENDQSDASNSQQKTLKKPDKILPCPRCNSMDTKFCYYNNYNINQPRHFCKSCQRYWTAGGTMRNVPVGAGRRKNKNPTSHCRHITISEALHGARIDAPNGIHHPAFKTNGTVLSFGSDSPLCESMTSVLNIAEKKIPNGTRNGLYILEPGITVPCKGGENGDDCSSKSSVMTSNSMAEEGTNRLQEPKMQTINGFPPQIPCLAGVPWPYPWSSGVPVPAICPSGFPMPFIPAPYWNCGVPGAWSIPWLSPTAPATNQKASSLGPNSVTLGKHSRDGDLLKASNPDVKESVEQKKSEGSILIPKTLRIDHPDEAAKSSIWATLGIKHDSASRGGFFKSFQQKADEKNHLGTNSLLLHANPAASSRSLSFQEAA
ncbi:unnamed protein product [Ilex paraguariensis]|uniref:Dof-type domain-containing protein n=1 Tax=Ilex paraguariensis TaxID=185542 RepID=A0ABC8R7U9_9AQUA